MITNSDSLFLGSISSGVTKNTAVEINTKTKTLKDFNEFISIRFFPLLNIIKNNINNKSLV